MKKFKTMSEIDLLYYAYWQLLDESRRNEDIGSFGKGMGTGLAETAKYSFFEVSEAGAITGLGAYGGVVAFGLAVSLAMSACYMVFNIL